MLAQPGHHGSYDGAEIFMGAVLKLRSWYGRTAVSNMRSTVLYWAPRLSQKEGGLACQSKNKGFVAAMMGCRICPSQNSRGFP